MAPKTAILLWTSTKINKFTKLKIANFVVLLNAMILL